MCAVLRYVTFNFASLGRAPFYSYVWNPFLKHGHGSIFLELTSYGLSTQLNSTQLFIDYGKFYRKQYPLPAISRLAITLFKFKKRKENLSSPIYANWNTYVFLFPEIIFITKPGQLINLLHYIGVFTHFRPLLITSLIASLLYLFSVNIVPFR